MKYSLKIYCRNRVALLFCGLTAMVLMLCACTGGGSKHLNTLLRLDRQAAQALAPDARRDVLARIDTLAAQAEPHDTAALRLSADIVRLLKQGQHYKQLMNYSQDIAPVVEKMAGDQHSQDIAISMNIDVAEAHSELGLLDRYTQLLIKEQPKAQHYGLKKQQAIIFIDLAYVYNEKGQYDRAIKSLNQAVELCKQTKDSINMCYAYNNIAWAHRGNRDYDRAVEYAMLALHMLSEKDSLLMMKTRVNIATYYTHMKAYAPAIEQLQTATDFYRRNNVMNELVIALPKLARAHWLKGDTKLAREYFDEAVRLMHHGSIPAKIGIVSNYAAFCDSVGDYRHEIALLQMNCALNDSIVRGNSGEMLTQLYEEELSKSDNAQKVYKHSFRTIMWCGVAMAVTAVLMVVGLVLFVKHQRRKAREMEKRGGMMHEQLMQATLERERDNSTIAALREDLLKLQKTIKTQSVKDASAQLRQVTSRVMRAEDQTQSADAWAIANPLFYKTLLAKWPELTTNDLRLCSMLRQGLSCKEIAVITGKETHSVEVARNRLRKKMNIKHGVDFTKFLLSI